MREAKSSSVYERSEYISGSLDWSRKEVVCRKKSARDEAPGMSGDWDLLLFIIRVKRELQRVNRNGCRYNERLNTETGGSKTPHTLGCAGKHIVSLVLVVSPQETVGLVRRSRIQST